MNRSAFNRRPNSAMAITRGSSGADLRQDPDTPPIGRQPAKVQIAPSKHYPWYGTIIDGEIVTGATGPIARAGGERFTAEQKHELARLRLDPDAVETLVVKRQATTQELWVPRGHLPPVFAFECPVIGRRNDKVKVITPSGTPKLVFPDGWGHHPIRIARGSLGEPLPPPLSSTGEI